MEERSGKEVLQKQHHIPSTVICLKETCGAENIIGFTNTCCGNELHNSSVTLNNVNLSHSLLF